ncbi:hypothetical protein [Flagellimonas iocasae]|uniref:DUF2306 domain-containing protein n=1 Tax=Flagellimonas iocasae TaxID=2055905 RepID=A0ABW4XZV0_9FLAO
MEPTIKILIYIHAFFGGVGLLSGIGSISVKKGSELHKKMGRIFTYSMLTSSSIALVISQMPNHKNQFLLLIGLFTTYLVLAGNRALTFNSRYKTKATLLDKSISGLMLAASIIMISIGAQGFFKELPNAILYAFFGGFGLFLTLGDFKTFKTFSQNKNAWLTSHLGRMVGALIASVTAFLVTAINIGSVVVWIAPTLLGTLYITYWNVKLRPKTNKKKAPK